MSDRDYLLIVHPGYKDHDLSFNLDEVGYVARIDNPEADGASFADSLAQGTISDDWVLEPAGSVPVQVMKVVRKTADSSV